MSSAEETNWEVVFYPDTGSNSPDAYLHSTETEDRAKFLRQVDTLSQLESWQWKFKWLKLIGSGLYQMRVNSHRFYFGIDASVKPRRLVFVHGCEKKKKKTKRSEIDVALARLGSYLETM